jgi:sporulation protein YlmC with PRC-barrel domain
MRKILIIGLTLVFTTVFALTGLAAQQGAEQQKQSQAGEQQREMRQGMAPQHLQGVEQARQIAGKTVKDQQGEEIGKIEALVIGEDQRSSYLIVSGEDDKMYPVPTSALQRGQEEGEYQVSFTKDQMQQAPSFEQDNWPNITEQQWQQRVHGYYEQQSGQQQQRKPQTGAVQQRSEDQQRTAEQQQQMKTGEQQAAVQQPIESSELEGRDILDPQGEKLGTIDSVIIGPNGQVDYVILSHGGFLGIGENLVPIPWQALQPAAEEDSYMVNINKDQIENAPQYSRSGDQPDFQNPEYRQQVHGYYGLGEGSAARSKTQQPAQEREKTRTPQSQ